MKGMTSKMHAREQASHDGKHNVPAKGAMATVKRVASGTVREGAEQCGGKHGSKGLGGADPNS